MVAAFAFGLLALVLNDSGAVVTALMFVYLGPLLVLRACEAGAGGEAASRVVAEEPIAAAREQEAAVGRAPARPRGLRPVAARAGAVVVMPVVLVVLAVLVALVAGAGWAAGRPPHTVPVAQAGRVVMVGLPHLGWPDLTSPAAPHLASLVRAGALGAVALPTAGRRPRTADGYASLGAGAPALARGPSGAVLSTGRPPREGDGGELAELVADLGLQSAPGAPGQLVDMAAPASRAATRRRHPGSLPGALGDAAHAAGARTAVVGVADRPGGNDRPAALAVMDGGGRVDGGRLDPARLLRGDQQAPWAVGADPVAVAGAVAGALSRADVLVVDPGDLDRAAGLDPPAGPTAAAADHRDALARTDAVLGQVASVVPRDTLLVLVAPAPPGREPALTPLVLAGPMVRPGELVSDSTRRAGIANLPDIAATVLGSIGVDEPRGAAGEPLRIHPGRGSARVPSLVRRLSGVDSLARRGDRLRHPAVAGFLAAQVTVAVFALMWLPPIGRGRAADRRLLRGAALALSSFPLATIALRALVARWPLDDALALVLLALLTAALAGFARAPARSSRGALLGVAAATLVALGADLATGGRLQISGVLGSSPTEGARFYGLGSAALGVAVGALLVGSALWFHRAPDRREGVQAVAAAWAVAAVVVSLPTARNCSTRLSGNAITSRGG